MSIKLKKGEVYINIVQHVYEKFLLAGEKIIETLDGKTYPVFSLT
jgi:hypothetical protein